MRQRLAAFQRVLLCGLALAALWLTVEVTLALTPSQPRAYPMPPAVPLCETDEECEALEAENPKLFNQGELQ